MSERDLAALIRGLSVTVVPGTWCMVSDVELPSDIAVRATIIESEGVTSVISTTDAERIGISPEFAMAWLTLDVHSALDAVGLTAEVASALAKEGIACNVLAGYHHDHLLVGFDDQDRAIDVLRRLGTSSPSG